MTPPESVRRAWGLEAGTVFPLSGGLINRSFTTAIGEEPYILQRLNTEIFDPILHEDIEAITKELERAGLQTTRLVPTTSGELFLDDSSGVWRLLTVVGRRTLSNFENPSQARSAGELVGRFHRATALLDWEIRNPRSRAGFHPTRELMSKLEDALIDHRDHEFSVRVRPLAEEILALFGDIQTPELPRRLVHGDLKLSNLRWDGDEAVALIDLDTLARGSLDAELGDALRSWCNPRGEDVEEPELDRVVFREALDGYFTAAPEDLSRAERESIVPGTLRITLELAARFATDVLEDRYFGWDHEHHSSRSDHNLVRATSQLALARVIDEQLEDLQDLVARI